MTASHLTRPVCIIETLSADVAAMIHAARRERAIVIGHDWGGGVAWAVAGFFPQRVPGSGGGELSATAGNSQALKRSPPTEEVALHGVLPAAGDSGAHADFAERIAERSAGHSLEVRTYAARLTGTRSRSTRTHSADRTPPPAAPRLVPRLRCVIHARVRG